MDWIFAKVLGSQHYYWSALAKVMHVWREMACQIYLAYVNLHSAVAAKDAEMKKVPPKPLTGRWGAAGACQTRLLKAGTRKLLATMTQAITQMLAERKPAKDSVDELGTEEIAHLREKMGQY